VPQTSLLDSVKREGAGRSLQQNVLARRTFKSISPAIDKRLFLVLEWESANRLSLNTSFITGIVHALVEQDAVYSIVLSASDADRSAVAYHMPRKRENYIQNTTSMVFCVRVLYPEG